MSLDGFVAGVDDNQNQPLGEGGEAIQGWLFSGDQPSRYNDFFKMSESNREVFDEFIPNTGAMVFGRRTFDIVNGWGGSHPISGIPIFVVTHEQPEHFQENDTPFTFVTDGVESALKQAIEVADGKNVVIGTPSIAQQCMKAGLLDVIQLHVSPLVLGNGVRLFDYIGDAPIKLESQQVTDGTDVVHLQYKVLY
ncbi:dihydrofolate reductase family protein [Piscibacillus halophilus]|uniref:Dihydrofolate reductase n=1 Tax=Piscibacillus halophilus TaxID=571933 RepID=A0A1H9MEC3_9BACI|nr:dihydrofolate reductase family protein [Piscibacillus halophilus]SER22120.1 Dihydrofolate reductase [Piscibacillus halophilus]